MSELCIDVDLLQWALESIDDGSGGCPFDAMDPNAPDHHGPEFAAALFEALKKEVADLAILKAKVNG